MPATTPRFTKMPTIYRRKAGNRRYIDYTKEQLEQCLNDVRYKIRTQRAAAAKYKIPRSTIKNKLKNKHCNIPGHLTIFTTEEEQAFVAHVTALSEFGFPITDIDLKIIIKDYLSARGRQFVEDLTVELDNIPPENIYNYDESSLIDDPGKKKVICRRGTKYPEMIVNATKKKDGRKVIIGDNLSSHINKNVLAACEASNISFICLPANATHILQPLDVAYFRPLKIKWRQVLLDWKNTPEGRRLPTVPKDQFPRLLKTALDSMKETQSYLVNGFRKTGIYPQNVEEPLSRLPRQDRIVDLNLISGAFMQNLKQLRNREQASPSGVNRSDSKKNAKSRKRLISEVSSSECSDTDISLASSTEDLILARDQSDDEEDNLRLAQLTNRNPRRNYDGNLEALGPSTQLPEPIPPDCNTRFIEDPLLRNCSKSDGQSCSNEDENKEGPPMPNKINPDDVQKAEEEYQNGDGYCINDHVLVKWNSRVYPGKIISISAEGALISCMKKGKFWRWPNIKDEQLYAWESVITKIGVPKFVKNGQFTVPELDKIRSL
ncbi:unnamed protein product [Acanthoscelides obtectus]|uniref:DDE-1 domain-containing protein n=1 Tax=Acanthoscelides obtectus TaxID=200917 RepID=A0A9P0KQF5_ACAOB|nr:unnamed protein product [Acanthoscelides obtectus]CAK1674817.1 hypothetical protein AOBTE_LOCUS29753 [Acanthoscelides obtectus]